MTTAAGPTILARLQLEDVALVAVMLLARPLDHLLSTGGPGPSTPADLLAGLISIVAAAGAIAALATRVPGESVLDASGEPARYAMIGPFIGGIGLIAGTGSQLLGFDTGGLFIGAAMVAAVLSMVFAARLPVVSPQVRRLMVAPFVLLAAGFFESLLSDMTGSLAGSGGLAPWAFSPEGLPVAATMVPILALASLVFYLMLIYAPRELADPGTRVRTWVVRFGLFFGSLLLGLLLGGSVPLFLG